MTEPTPDPGTGRRRRGPGRLAGLLGRLTAGRLSRRAVVTIVVVALAAGAGTAAWARSVQDARVAEQVQADALAAQEAERAAEELREAEAARDREREARAARLAEERAREAAEQERAEQERAEREAAAQEQAAQEAAEQQRAEQERAEREAEEARRAAEQAEAAPPSLGGPPSTGAGPDCGGPESYEPPRNGEYTFYTSTPETTGDGSNGKIPRSQMAAVDWCVDSQGNAQWFLPEAAAALTALNAEFRRVFGENIAIDMSYRSYATQVQMREAYGSIAARPGTSNHGTGTAFDTWEWAAYSFGSARYEWLVANGPAYGWVAPGWARADGSNPEYWHFEYTG